MRRLYAVWLFTQLSVLYCYLPSRSVFFSFRLLYFWTFQINYMQCFVCGHNSISPSAGPPSFISYFIFEFYFKHSWHRNFHSLVWLREGTEPNWWLRCEFVWVTMVANKVVTAFLAGLKANYSNALPAVFSIFSFVLNWRQ